MQLIRLLIRFLSQELRGVHLLTGLSENHTSSIRKTTWLLNCTAKGLSFLHGMITVRKNGSFTVKRNLS